MKLPPLAKGTRLMLLSSIAILTAAPGFAATITKTGSDGFGASGFTSGALWSNSLVPSAGNDYVNTNFNLRTPNTALDYTFGGDSLTLQGGGQLNYKGTVNNATITVNNLTLDNGVVTNQYDATSNVSQTRHFNLAGSVTLAAGGGLFGGQSTLDGTGITIRNMVITADIDGLGKFIARNTNATAVGSFASITLTGTTSYEGGTEVRANTRLIVQSNAGSGGNIDILSGGRLRLDINTALGVDQNLVLANGLAAGSIDLNFAGENSIAGLSFDGGTTFAALGTYGAIGSGAMFENAVFTGAGMLTVVPEPSEVSLLIAGGLAVLAIARRARARRLNA